LNGNLFWQNRVNLITPEASESMILVLCMIANKTMPLIVRDLVWIETCVYRGVDECSLFFLSFMCLIRFDQKIFKFLCLYEV